MSAKAVRHRRDTAAVLMICIACLVGLIAVVHYLFPPYQGGPRVASLAPGKGGPAKQPPRREVSPTMGPPAPGPAQRQIGVQKEAQARHGGSAAAMGPPLPPVQAARTPPAAAKAPPATAATAPGGPHKQAVRPPHRPAPAVAKKHAPQQHPAAGATTEAHNGPVQPQTQTPGASPGPSAAPSGVVPPAAPPAPAPSVAHEGGGQTAGPAARAIERAPPQPGAGQAGIETTPKGLAIGRGPEVQSQPEENRRQGRVVTSEGRRPSHKTLKDIWPTYIHATRVNVPIPGRQWVATRVDSLKKKRFDKIVPQHFDYSCGAASLATLLTYYFGRITSEKEAMKGMIRFGDPELIRERGFSLLDMQKFANEIGYRAGGYKVNLKQLKKVHIPLIVLINVSGRPHFVVLKGVRDGLAFLADPSVGNHVMSLREFGEVWNGTIFALQGPKDDGAPGLPLVAARPSGPDDQVASMGLGFQFPLALDPARRMYINEQLAPPGILLPSGTH